MSKTDADLRALFEYGEGLAYLDRGKYDEARAHFAQALKYSPNYEKAKRRHRQVMPLLALVESQ